MPPQVTLALALVVALLGGVASEQCELVERENRSPGGLMMTMSPLAPASALNVSACRARCCELEACDTAVHEPVTAQCRLLNCAGKCVLQEDDSGAYSVFVRSAAPPPGGAPHIEPMMLDTSAHDNEPSSNNNDNNNNSSDVCALPRVVGMCKAMFPRFFYDSEEKTCRSFIYGGCGANANNFETLSECNKTCGEGGVKDADKGEAPKERKSLRMAVLPPGEAQEAQEDEEDEADEAKEMSSDDFKELCAAPPVVGPCRAAFQRWFYNDTRGRCQKFIYGGCKGNKNNHESEKQCRSICAGVKLLPLKKKQLPDTSDDFKAHCAAAPESGPCRAAFPMFYYDPETQSCKRFLYGGCRGNDNRYDSEGECEERCANQGGSYEGRGSGRSRWTSAFFLFLTLGGVSFLLLTALIFITMRCRRNHATPRRTLSIRSDKEELLPDSERSSVDSLPLPESPNKA